MVYSETSVIISEFTQQHGIKKTMALHLCATNVTGLLLACFVVIFAFIYVFWSFTKNSVKTRVKFGGTLSQKNIMATLVKQRFPSSPVLLPEFTINGRCAVKGSARGDAKEERGETPFHRPPSHHPSRSLRSRSLEFRFPTCDPNKVRVNSETEVSRKHSL